MNIFEAVMLGALQGITEFLPVSSSGHLVLLEQVLHVDITPKDMQALNVLLHAGTLCALFMAYAPVWWELMKSPFVKDKENVRRLVLLIVATIPGAVAGLLFEDFIAHYFQSLLYLGGAFAVTAVVLLSGEYFSHEKHTRLHRLLHPIRGDAKKLTTRSAFFIGITQALALVPGLSRSGLTISTARIMGLNRKDALDFSFLMAVPIIGGATMLSLKDIVAGAVVLPAMQITTMAVAVSFVSSLISIIFLRAFIVKRSLVWFAPYLFIASAFTIALYFHR